MVIRQRNTILFFLQDDGLREMLMETVRTDGWSASGTSDIQEALRLFGALGESLALVVTDDMTGPDEGRRRGMLGVNFLQQRSTHMFVANVPFVLLMFTGRRNVRAWADSVGGWTVAMPMLGRTSVLLELFSRLEAEHRLPPKPQSRSVEL